MPFLNRQQIPAPLRAKAEKEHRSRLRQALLNPALTADQKGFLREQLLNVGKPRVYSAGSPAKVGAIQLVAEPAFSPDVPVQEPEIRIDHENKEVLDAKGNTVSVSGSSFSVSGDGVGSGSDPDSGTGRRRGSGRRNRKPSTDD